jgi:hypothetical protein
MNSHAGKVGFFIVGAQKSGTTALDFYMRQHPEICMASRKEVHFFDNEKYFADKLVDYGLYHSYFQAGPGHRLMGETTPAYMYWWPAVRRLWEYNPGARLMVILRNPVERAFSHWNMQRERGIEQRPFLDALRGERGKCRESLPLQNRRFSYIDRGFYTEQIRRLAYYFPQHQLLILKNEDLRNRAPELLDNVWRFLGISALDSITQASVHTHNYDKPMTGEEREFLGDVFEYEIRQLERMLGWDCADWLA